MVSGGALVVGGGIVCGDWRVLALLLDFTEVMLTSPPNLAHCAPPPKVNRRFTFLHFLLLLKPSLSIHLSIHTNVYPYICISVHICLSVHLSICTMCLYSLDYQSINLPVHLTLHNTVYLSSISVHPTSQLTIYLNIHPSVPLNIHLTLHLTFPPIWSDSSSTRHL